MGVLPEYLTGTARQFEHATADTGRVCRGVGLWYARKQQPRSAAYMLLASWLLERLRVTAANMSVGLLRHDYQQPTVPLPPRGHLPEKSSTAWEDDNTVLYPILGDALCAPADYVERHLAAFLLALERKRGAIVDHHRSYAEIQHDAAVMLCADTTRALFGLADTAGWLANLSGREDWNLQLGSDSLPDAVIDEMHHLDLSGAVINQIISLPLPPVIHEPRVISTTLHNLQHAANRLGSSLEEWVSTHERLPG